jgi:large subunit ribosomal protein L13
MKTFVAKEHEVDRKWIVVDAEGKVLGRLAAAIATVLMGKSKPIYTPHVDTGDFVVVINCEKIRLTGKKMTTKTYQRYSGYPGGLKIIPIATVLAKHPERVIREAVRRMLPKNKLGRKMLTKLKVYAGDKHPHEAQNPQPVELKLK